MDELSRVIAAEHATWDEPCVDREVFGPSDPDAISQHIDAWCREFLGAAVSGAAFYRVSTGCVAGLRLADGREVVVKAQANPTSLEYLRAVQRVTAHLADRGFACPRPLAAPAPLVSGIATAESSLNAGEAADAREPPIRRAMAHALAEVVALARDFVSEPALGPAWFTAVPDSRIWPRPHSSLFDFGATAAGAEWIDELAQAARARRTLAAGDRVVGHFDWRVEHLRFDHERVVASYDWDSLHCERETVMVGAAAHAFTADWSRPEGSWVQVPTVDEMRAFVADYEDARGTPFTRAERATVAGSLVYACAYSARCNHALRPDEVGGPGDFRPLLSAWGSELLESL